MKTLVTGILASALLVSAAPAALAAARHTVDRLKSEQSEIYGNYVADGGGRSLYMFTPDKPGKGRQEARSVCYDACAEAWPPVLAKDLPRVSGKLDKKLLGTTKRKDGSTQVTYGGWPLYYYVGDRGTGQIAGQDIHSFGGGWYLVSPDGSVIKREG
ncbi:MAG: hypothetical protein ACLFV8_15030 [Alphaproteobacteria bacterium]